MKHLLTILLLSVSITVSAQTANAGEDKTLYMSDASYVILDGSASTGSVTWTEISTDFNSGGTIENPTSKETLLSGLTKQGTFYFKITSGSSSDTMVVRVEVSAPPVNGTIYREFDMTDPTVYNPINDRTDTTGYYPTGGPKASAGTEPNRFYLFRDRLPNMAIDAQKSKLLNQNVDGYAGEEGVAGGYPRTELQLCDACFRFDTTKTYMFEWKGYFPQNTNWMVLDGDPDWSALLIIWQTHGFKYDYAIANFELAHDGTINFVNEITGDTTQLSDSYEQEKVQVGTLDSFYNKSQTIRVTMREGISNNAFIKVEVNGVQRYYRQGRVGSAFFDDYVKFGGIYDWRSWMTNGDSLSRGRRWGLVTESFKVYELSDAPVTPYITWAPPSAITYGTALSSTQLNASSDVEGTFSYNYPIGTIFNAGSYTLTTTFNPTDGSSYLQTTKSVTLVVNKATATLSYSGLTKTYNGTPQQPTITTSPVGLTGVSTTYNGVSQVPVNAGSYTVTSGLNNPNYSASIITNTFVINKANTVISVSNISQTYTGSPLPIYVTTTPNVSGISVTYNGSSTVPTSAGSYTVVATLTNQNYSATPITTTLVINKATPIVSWANPSAITYGTALSGTQLNAAASVAGLFSYTPGNGTILNAGTNILSVNFTPTDATNYNSVNNTTTSLTVNKATATINISNLTQTYDGTPKPVSVTTSPIGLSTITTTYNGSTTVPSSVGSYTVSSSLSNSNYTATPATGTLVISASAANIFITNYDNLVYNGNPQTPTVTSSYPYSITYDGSSTPPTNVGNYVVIATINDGVHTGADTVDMVIIKATPSITWNNPSSITYGTALSSTQLNASSSVSGSFSYTPGLGTALNAGTYVLSTSFTPTDTNNYNIATSQASITVNKASATLSLSNLIQVYDGTPKSVTIISNPSDLDGIVVTYNGSSTIPTNAGSYSISGTLTNSNYSASGVFGTLVIQKATPILSWTIPQAIQAGSKLTSTQLNASSSVGGSFVYSLPLGTVMTEGAYSIIATFTPSSSNYNTGTISVLLNVYGNPFTNFIIGDYYKNQ